MGFGIDLEPKAGDYGSDREFRQIRWMYLRPGIHVVRVMQTEPHATYTHWVNKKNVECLGEDECPICISNKKLRMQDPENYSKNSAFNPPRITGYVNVFDKTPVKVCPKCQSENHANQNQEFSPVCYKDNESLISVVAQPSNTLKVFSRSKTVFDMMANVEQATGEPLTEYDLTLVVKPPSGGGTNVTVIPQVNNNQPVELEEELFDLEEAVLSLEADEIMELKTGATLRDIFAARRSGDSDTIKELENEEFDEEEDKVPFEDEETEEEHVAKSPSDFLERFKKNK